jgi:hypothetical protein
VDLPIQSIATEIAKTALGAAKGLGKLVGQRIEGARLLEEYLRLLSNRVGYFVAYRPSRQSVEAAYIRPLLIRGSLSLSHVPLQIYEQYVEIAEEALQLGVPISTVKYSVPLIPGVERLLHAVRYVSLDDLITDHKNTLVLSEPGAGKTSLLTYLCFRRLKLASPRLPIFVESSSLQHNSLLSAINEAIAPLGIDLAAAKYLGSALALYVDGLDELPPSHFKQICVDLSRLGLSSPEIAITASCRSAAYHNELSFLQELSILPFDQSRSKAFVRAWFKGIDSPISAESLIQDINKSAGLKELSSQPLLLCLVCNVYRRYLNISRRHSTLFEQCINALLWQWDADRAVKRSKTVESLDLQKQIWLHSRLAARMYQLRRRFAGRAFLLDALERELPYFGIDKARASEVLDDITSHNGIVAKFTEETFGFSHIAFQEFLTAKYYANEERWTELLRQDRLIDPWWQPVIALTCAIASDATRIMTAIDGITGMPDIAKLGILTDCIRHDPIVEPHIRNRVLRTVLDWYHNGDAQHHDAAAYMLVGIEDDWCAGTILRSLEGRLPTKALAKLVQRGRGTTDQEQ